MRNGDSYKIKSMSQTGVSDSDICQFFRNKYDAEEVKRFIPAKPRSKRRARAETSPED